VFQFMLGHVELVTVVVLAIIGERHHVLYMGMATQFFNAWKRIPAMFWTHGWWLSH
jgi:hypothetical protein